MKVRANGLLILCCIALLLAMPGRVSGQESLAAARQLYASAEYQSALSMLTGLLAGNPSPQDHQSLELYRVFCLFAIGNPREANSALESMIARDPLYRPNMDEVPRRLRTAISEARKRLLPSIIEQKYDAAKTAFEAGQFKAASAGFTEVLIALSDPDVAAEAQQRPLSDLKVLATGFNELTVRSMAPPPAPEPLPAPALAVTAATPIVRSPKIYDGHDADVKVPIAVRQEMPPFPGQIFGFKTGALDVVIDETGAVESATMVTPLDARYNALVVAAAKMWLYRPATLDGAPVKFKKRIQIALSPTK